MSAYSGRHAELYDLFYADKPYEAEAAFVDDCLRRLGRPESKQLLELACGTGRHALALEKLGYEVSAIDSSNDMITCARRRGAQADSAVDFRCADMRSMGFADASFDAAICLFDSLGYVRSNQAVGQVLDGLNRGLRPDGIFLFEFWHAAAMLRGYDPVRVARWSTPDGQVVRIAETTVDSAQQVSRVHYTIYELHHSGCYETLNETQVNRFFLVQEMANLLIASGFEPLKWFAGFVEDETITADTWHVVAVARKHAAATVAAA